jgi:general secretion pathway protein G
MKNAFTLIELIFVIVVIGILATVAIPKFNDTRELAISNGIKQDIATIVQSIKSKYMIKGDISDISDAVDFDDKIWILDSTKLILEYKISNISCVKVQVDKSTTVNKVNVNITPASHELCQKVADNGVINSSESLY